LALSVLIKDILLYGILKLGSCTGSEGRNLQTKIFLIYSMRI
jgi:hypothetical protein